MMNQVAQDKAVAVSARTRRVPIVIRAKGASSVAITGDFGPGTGEVSLQPQGKDGWATTLNLSPGEHRYRLIVDGRLLA